MYYKLTFYCLLFIVSAQAQNFTTSKHPIVIITTEGEEIPDEPKVEAQMRIIANTTGQLNSINDAILHYEGNIGIETRGNSTQGFEKKTYSLETRDEDWDDQAVELLGMGKEEDWILHAMVIDKTQLRIPMSFYFFQRMGHYAANWRYVELIVDGDYRGLYILTEKIKRDKNRVDIAKMDEDDIAGDPLTGGYILRIDWLDDEEGFRSRYESQGGEPMTYQWYYPKAEKIQDEQAEYIEEWINQFETAVFSDDFTHNGTRYTDYIDVASFTDFLLINELSKNADGYKLSSYLHKERDSKGGKLAAGPIWDFDQTYGVSEVCSNYDYEGWTYLQNQADCEDLESMPLWWRAMMSDPVFTNYLACRWEAFRSGPLHQDSVLQWIDTHRADISDAIERNFERLDFIGERIWIEPSPIPQSYEAEIAVLKTWISNRLRWMDENLPGNCDDNTITSTTELEATSLNIFPNPATESVLIRAEIGDKIELLSIDGQLLQHQQLRSTMYRLDITKLEAGVYLLRVRGRDSVQIKILVVE